MCYYPIPFAYAKNIFEIELNFYKKLGVKYLLMDLDNTLDSYLAEEPTERAIIFISKLKENNITPIIISNNKGPRVKKYSECLGINYLPKSGKPFSSKIKKYMTENGINPNEAIMVGDQLATDIKAAKGAGIKNILVDKIVEEDQKVTKFNRFFEKPFRKRMAKKNRLIDWRTIYGEM